MPCYLFTYHSYGSWMPDRRGGFVRRGEGVLSPDQGLATKYWRDAKQREVEFESDLQHLVIEEVLKASEFQGFRVHYVATETTHVHILASWSDDRPWIKLRSGLKSSLTRRLSREIARRRWFSDSASRKHVNDRAHYDHLVNEYLPTHRGWKWREGKDGLFR